MKYWRPRHFIYTPFFRREKNIACWKRNPSGIFQKPWCSSEQWLAVYYLLTSEGAVTGLSHSWVPKLGEICSMVSFQFKTGVAGNKTYMQTHRQMQRLTVPWSLLLLVFSSRVWGKNILYQSHRKGCSEISLLIQHLAKVCWSLFLQLVGLLDTKEVNFLVESMLHKCSVASLQLGLALRRSLRSPPGKCSHSLWVETPSMPVTILQSGYYYYLHMSK